MVPDSKHSTGKLKVKIYFQQLEIGCSYGHFLGEITLVEVVE